MELERVDVIRVGGAPVGHDAHVEALAVVRDLFVRAFAEQMGLFSDSPVRISLEGERLVIESVRRATLADLLAEVTPDNLHDETDWGESVGKEVW